MAKPNYAYAKRQRELAKKKKQEDKRLRKIESHSQNSDEVLDGQEETEGESEENGESRTNSPL